VASTVSMTLPESMRCTRRCILGKFSSLDMRLSVKSIVSKASLVAAKFSIDGMAKPRKMSSLSPNGFVRCSANPIRSADILMFQ